MNKTPRKIAEDFINGQLKIMAKHGAAPRASKKQIAESIGQAEKSFAALAADHENSIDLR